MKTWMETTPYLAMLAAALLIPACDDSKPFNETITVSSSAGGMIPFGVDRMYYCDHTNLTNLEHRHPINCGRPGACPTLNANGKMTPARHGAPCPDTSYGGLGIKTQLEAMSRNTTSTANSVKSAVSTRIGAAVGQKVDASGEVSKNLSAGAKGKVKAAITRDAQASFERKWSKEAERAINSQIQSKTRQLLSIVATVGGTFGCGQKNQVGIDYHITIVVVFSGSAVISGTVTKDGTVSGLTSNWTAFTLTVNLGLAGPGLVPDRHATSCVCVPREEPTGTPSDKGGNDKTVPRFPWEWSPWDFFGSRPLSPKDRQFFADAQPIYIAREDLKGFTASDNVMVAGEERKEGEEAPTAIVVAATGAAGAYGIYKVVADSSKTSGPNVVSSVEEMKQISKGVNAYKVPNEAGQMRKYTFDAKRADGSTKSVAGHNLGSFDGGKTDVVVVDSKDGRIETLERLNVKDAKTGEWVGAIEMLTIDVRISVEQMMHRLGRPLRGWVIVHASKAFAEKYPRVKVIFTAKGFTPEVISMGNVPVNTRLELPKTIATQAGKRNVSATVHLPWKRR